MITLMALLACKASVQVTYETNACEDWSFSNEDEEIFDRVDGEGVVEISRIGVTRGCDDVFAPVIEAEGWQVVVWEDWSVGGDDCEACRVATVVFEGADAADLTLHWFDESSNVTPVCSTP